MFAQGRTNSISGSLLTRPVHFHELDQVARIERCIEGEHAASLKTLQDRLQMYPRGFRAGVRNNAVVGYVESCRWDNRTPSTFEEIRNFPEHHRPNGNSLYVIYLAVDPAHQKQGIARSIMVDLIEFARSERVDKIQLAAGPGFLSNFYASLGFVRVKELPGFAFGTDATWMEYPLK